MVKKKKTISWTTALIRWKINILKNILRFLNKILFVAIIIFLIFIFIRDYETFFGFNPDEDICLEWECLNCASFDNCLENGCYAEVCEEWREKTICELSPESEGCICDEYEAKYEPIELPEFNWVKTMEIDLGKDYDFDENQYMRMYFNKEIDYKVKKVIRDNNTYMEIYNLKEIWETKLTKVGEVCVKSHLPDECEKGNPDWVLEEFILHEEFIGDYTNKPIPTLFNITEIKKITYNYTTNITSIFYLSNDDYTWDGFDVGKRICRKKTIEDYSCEELKKQLYFNEELCIGYDGTFNCEVFNPDYYFTPQEIYDIAIEKGCEI
jgi:hypothetical protein